MTTQILSYTKNPNILDKKLEIVDGIEKTKEKIIKETERKISIEEWQQMSWKDLKKNIEVDKDGNIYIFGKSLDYWILEMPHFWTEEQKDGLAKYLEDYNKNQEKILEKTKKQVEEFSLMQEILQIWETKAISVINNIWFRGYRDEDDDIKSYIKEINKIIKIIPPIAQKILEENFNKIFNLMIGGEEESSIIGEKDMKEVRKIFFDKNLSKEEKEIKIFNLMRYGGLSGNSETIKDIVANKLLEKEDFKKEKEILNNPKLREYLEDENLLKLREILTWEQADKVLEIYKKTKERLESALEKKLGEFNKKRKKEGKTEKEKKALTLEEFKKVNNFDGKVIDITKDTFKHFLISQKLDKKGNRGNKNKSFEGMYANMIGLAEKNEFIRDAFVFADEQIDALIDFGVTLVIGAITMGVGSLATGATMWGIRGVKALAYANRGSKFARGVYKVSSLFKKGRFIKYPVILANGDKVTRAVSLQSIIGSSVVEGIAFHEGATLAVNVLFRDSKDWNHGLTDKHEIIKSIAFMAGLNSLHYVSGLPGMAQIMNFKMKIPKEYLDKSVILKVLEGTGNFTISGVREGSIMFGISQVIEQVLGEGWNPTVEEYLQFVALIQLMHLKNLGKRN